jgi:hypothetical protein
MSKDSKTPQAFPYSGEGDELNYSKGMTLRDYAAIKAMQGILASNTEHEHEDAHIFDAIAEASYKQADAMLKARKA